MTIGKIGLALGVFTLGVAMAASSHHVTVYNSVWVGTTELKPGDYNVQVDKGKAVFKSKKDTVEVPAKMETANAKYQFTSLNTDTTGGKAKLNEIDLGGTNMKIVIGSTSPNAAE